VRVLPLHCLYIIPEHGRSTPFERLCSCRHHKTDKPSLPASTPTLSSFTTFPRERSQWPKDCQLVTVSCTSPTKHSSFARSCTGVFLLPPFPLLHRPIGGTVTSRLLPHSPRPPHKIHHTSRFFNPTLDRSSPLPLPAWGSPNSIFQLGSSNPSPPPFPHPQYCPFSFFPRVVLKAFRLSVLRVLVLPDRMYRKGWLEDGGGTVVLGPLSARDRVPLPFFWCYDLWNPSKVSAAFEREFFSDFSPDAYPFVSPPWMYPPSFLGSI